MIWAAIKEDRTKILVRYTVRLNSYGYMDVLNKRMLPIYDIFQDGNAPCHKSRVVSSFMDNYGIFFR